MQHHGDARQNIENKKQEKEAFKTCEKKIKEHGLDMKLMDVEFKFDKSKILFFFTADGRIDFRELVRDLASVYKTRIEMRQVGVRDEVRRIGGNGVCGRELCCCSFLGNFETVSIKMAKEQNVSLNPSKISGNCGRLMCCLQYEQNVYEEKLKKLPKIGAIVKTQDGQGEVCGLETLKEIVKVKFKDGDETFFRKYNAKDIKIIKNIEKESNEISKEDLAELKKIREEAANKINLRTAKDGYRVVVGMATCGITAGARPVLAAFVDQVAAKHLDNVTVTQVGCLGECALEPVVEVFDANGNRTTYAEVHVEDVEHIIEQHIIGGKVITEKTLEAIKAAK